MNDKGALYVAYIIEVPQKLVDHCRRKVSLIPSSTERVYAKNRLTTHEYLEHTSILQKPEDVDNATAEKWYCVDGLSRGI